MHTARDPQRHQAIRQTEAKQAIAHKHGKGAKDSDGYMRKDTDVYIYKYISVQIQGCNNKCMSARKRHCQNEPHNENGDGSNMVSLTESYLNTSRQVTPVSCSGCSHDFSHLATFFRSMLLAALLNISWQISQTCSLAM